MADDRVRVSRTTLIRALHDAIDWQASILETHNPLSGRVESCCVPDNRCEQYKLEERWMNKYQQTLTSIPRHKGAP